MLILRLIESDENTVKYRFYPEKENGYGIISMDKKTGEVNREKEAEGYNSTYVIHAIQRIYEYRENNFYPEKDTVAWY